ncbi:MAG: nitroreductase family deazaflavin-dependent oxidoreductase [Acidimicrobiales bacterium]
MPTFKDASAKALTAFHRSIFDLTKGKVAGKAFGMPVVKLTTIGRKSGKQRDTMLTTPIHDDTKVVLVASYGGDDRHPAWYVNLSANPKVTITMQGTRRDMLARTASADEKQAMWPTVTSAYKGYAGYQEKTDRDIPLVILEPRA